MKSYRRIERLHNLVVRSLFYTDCKLSYERTIEAIIRLTNALRETETDETVWSIGECSACDLGSLIVGSFWYADRHHSGQDSPEYAALSALGRIYSPGMTDGPEPESSELEANIMWEMKRSA